MMRLISLTILTLACAACGPMIPSTPIQPGARQSSANIAQDERACAASKAYEACMIARGYRASVLVGKQFGMPALTMNIEATKRVTADVVGSDLAECGSRVRSAWSGGDKTHFVTSGALIGFGVAAPDTMNRLRSGQLAFNTPVRVNT